MVEQTAHNGQVTGSNPVASTIPKKFFSKKKPKPGDLVTSCAGKIGLVLSYDPADDDYLIFSFFDKSFHFCQRIQCGVRKYKKSRIGKIFATAETEKYFLDRMHSDQKLASAFPLFFEECRLAVRANELIRLHNHALNSYSAPKRQLTEDELQWGKDNV